jgi:pimeloyl-ACP methyl ester carboxylesterase
MTCSLLCGLILIIVKDRKLSHMLCKCANWLLKHDGQKFVSLGLRKSFVLGWAATWFDVWSRSCDINLFESWPAISCPVYFFAGKKDYNTNSSITREYFNKVSEPKKDLFFFENAGHGLPETDPGRFQDIIINKILPETYSNPRL